MTSCCVVVEPLVPDIAHKLRMKAYQEVLDKGIRKNIITVTQDCDVCVMGGCCMIVEHRGNTLQVTVNKEVVFLDVRGDLRKYVCGPWIDDLAAEAKSIRAKKAQAIHENNLRHIRNHAATQRYALCC